MYKDFEEFKRKYMKFLTLEEQVKERQKDENNTCNNTTSNS